MARKPPTHESSEPQPREGSLLADWHAIVIIGLLVAVFFRDILLQRAFFWEDFLTQAYPFRTFAAVSLASGELPLWNPYTFGGMPFQADIQSAIFYIPNLLLTPFVRDGRLPFYAFEVALVLHYWIAGVCMYFLARELRLERWYSLFSGVGFALSGFLIVQAIHPAFIQQLAWFPLAVLLLHRALHRDSLGHAIMAGLVVGLSLLAGAPQITLFLYLLLGLYSLFIIISAARDRGVRASLPMLRLPPLVVLVSLGVAAVQLLPTVELRPLSERASMTFEQAQSGRLAWEHILTAVVPKIFGYTSAQARTYWGPGEYGAYWETCFYLGIVALFAALYALTLIRRSRVVLFLVVLAMLAFLLALGDQFILHRLFFDYVPGFSAFRGIGRMAALTAFAGALLAGFGLRAFVQGAARHPARAERLLLAAGGAMIALWLLLKARILLPPTPPLDDAIIFASTMREMNIALAITLASCALCFAFTRGVIGARLLVPLLLVTQYADMHIFGFAQNNSATSAADYFDEITPDVIRILKAEGEKEVFRVASRRDTILFLDRNHGMVERIFLLEGYTPLKLRRSLPVLKDLEATYDLMNVKYRPRVIDQDGAVALRSSPSYFPRAFMVHDAVVMDSPAAVDAYVRSEAFAPRREVVLDREPGVSLDPDAVMTPAIATISLYRLNEITVDVVTPRNGVLVLSEIHYPGWRARINGVVAPLYRGDGTLRAVPLRAGSHRVSLSFEPRSFHHGAVITALTLALSLGWLLWLGRRAGGQTRPKGADDGDSDI